MAELEDLGWDAGWAAALAGLEEVGGGTVARIAIEHRGAVEVLDAGGGFWAEPTGKMFRAAADKRALPTVGDWVVVSDAETARTTGSRAPLRAILPRRSCLVRRAAGEREEPQPIAANVDVAFVVTSANQDLNPRRLERYLVTVRDGGARPVIIVNKSDLAAIAAPTITELSAVAGDAPLLYTSALNGWNLDQVAGFLGRGKTAVFVGSSGVGKSTLIGALMAGQVDLTTQPARAHDDRGKHTTTRRELYLLTGGGVLIDTPGMRELQLWGDPEEELAAFEDVATIARGCKFSDCRHAQEPGCAVRTAVAAGTLTADRVAAWQKLVAERAAGATRRTRRR